MIDWYDRNQCHNTDPNAHDRSNGRIFKIVYGDTKTTPVDLQKKSDAELAALQAHPNDLVCPPCPPHPPGTRAVASHFR